MTEQSLSYSNEAELNKLWVEGYHTVKAAAKKCTSKEMEYVLQQEWYSKYASVYDDAIIKLENFSGHLRVAKKINELYIHNKSIKILDYGCGTGLVAEQLLKLGFCEVDGVDSNQEMLACAAKKGVMKQLILGKDDQGLKDIPSDTYDVVCASAVLLLSPSHPGYECLNEMCRIVKSGGKIIVLSRDEYLSQFYVNSEVVEKLEKDGVLKAHPKELFEGYRSLCGNETDDKSVGVILTFDVS